MLRRRGTPELSLGKVADELKKKLAENPPLNRLATNPLMCAMICALHRQRQQKLPESQSELVEALCHTLLHRREQESGLRLDAFATRGAGGPPAFFEKRAGGPPAPRDRLNARPARIEGRVTRHCELVEWPEMEDPR